MCGIFGTINHKVTEHELVFSELMHRGPDQQNFLGIGSVELFHARLAIQDLSENGRQPMSHGGLHISFNGEIYNYNEMQTAG